MQKEREVKCFVTHLLSAGERAMSQVENPSSVTCQSSTASCGAVGVRPRLTKAPCADKLCGEPVVIPRLLGEW